MNSAFINSASINSASINSAFINPVIEQLPPYPFAKMTTLLAGIEPAKDQPLIKLGIGEPKHPPPKFVLDALLEHVGKVQHYPNTGGMPELSQAIADWLSKRFHLTDVDPNHHIIPVMGSREAIFSFVQAVINRHHIKKPYVVMPNPFYQIYEGATLLAGAKPYYVPCTADTKFKADYANVPADVWQRTQLVFVCSPNNPTGSVLNQDDWQHLLALADEHDFVIASDECYSELYFDTPPIGLLQACATLGRDDYDRCVVFHSLSKRSNLPGLRSGFVAGDAKLLNSYLQYRTYHGCAMPLHHQHASMTAWQDETHVQANRDLYTQKFDLWLDRLGNKLNLRRPEASFYLWVAVPDCFDNDDECFIKSLYSQCGIHALAGRYLSRDVGGQNPGQGFVRLALVASMEENHDAIERIDRLLKSTGY